MRVTDFKEKPQGDVVDARPPGLRDGLDGQLHLLARSARRRAAPRPRPGARATSASICCRAWPGRTGSSPTISRPTRCPGTAPFEEPAYWRDVGTIEAYFEAHMDTLGAQPKFRMTNPAWPHLRQPRPGRERADRERRDPPLGRRLGLHRRRRHARPRHAAPLGHGRGPTPRSITASSWSAASSAGGARLRRVIVDQDNVIPAGETIGFDPEGDRRRFHVSDSGIVVVPRAFFPKPAGRVSGRP